MDLTIFGNYWNKLNAINLFSHIEINYDQQQFLILTSRHVDNEWSICRFNYQTVTNTLFPVFNDIRNPLVEIFWDVFVRLVLAHLWRYSLILFNQLLLTLFIILISLIFKIQYVNLEIPRKTLICQFYKFN